MNIFKLDDHLAIISFTLSELGNSSQHEMARIWSRHFFHSPVFIALDAATMCSRMLSAGPTANHGTVSVKITLNLPPWCNPPWYGEGAYLTKRFRLDRQQEELVGTTQPRSSRTNWSSLCKCQEPDSKWKNLDKRSHLIFSIFLSYVGLDGVIYHIVFFRTHGKAGISPLEGKFDRFRDWDEGTRQKHQVTWP